MNKQEMQLLEGKAEKAKKAEKVEKTETEDALKKAEKIETTEKAEKAEKVMDNVEKTGETAVNVEKAGETVDKAGGVIEEPGKNSGKETRKEFSKKERAKREKPEKEKVKKEKQKKEKNGKRKKRRKAPIIIAVIIILLIVIKLVACGGNSQAGAVVTTTQALRGELQESVSTSGTVLSEQVKVIFAPVSGTLDQVNVAAGDAVKAGELLVSYNSEKLSSSLRQSELQLEKSNASYDSVLADDSKNQWKLYEANHNLEILNQQITDTKAYIKDLENQLSESQRNTNNALAKESMDLSNKLRGLQNELAGLTPGSSEYAGKEKEIQDVNNAMTYNSYVSQIAANSDYVSEMQQKIADAQDTLAGYEKYKAEMESQKASTENVVMDSYDKTQYNAEKELADLAYQATEADYELAMKGITADFDGIVTECSAIPGSGVNEGMQLLTLQSSNNLKISFSASKNDIAKLELGQKADVVISGKTYPGEISKINRMAEKNASGTPMVGVEIHLLEVDDTIILGMDAKITVYTDKTENALLIPVEAINADRDGDFLYTVEDGVVVKKSVVCGISTDTYTEIVEGISEEDVIVLSAYTTLEEGMPVTVLPAQ